MKIRNATKGDVGLIAKYLLSAMEDVVYKFIGRKDYNQALEFLCYFIEKENNQYSYQNCLVAEDNGEVVAAVNLYDGAKLHELRAPVAQYLKMQYGIDFKPEDETQAGELYIDSFGVCSNKQGQGIGSELLQFLIDEYVTNKGQTLGLLVDKENPKAKKLYFKLGFKPVGRKELAGKNLEHLQVAKS